MGLGGVGNYGGVSAIGAGLGGKRVIPTFGVSFGLPSVPAGPLNGYPINPLGSYPLQNPYFGSISSNGLNLGLVNVNPLVSFQVAKNEFGEKLFRPLVNLHVTPNANIVQQIGAYLRAKKHGGGGPSYNKHYHTHTHLGPPPEVYHPQHFDGPHNNPPQFPHNIPPQFPHNIPPQLPYSSGSNIYEENLANNYNELPPGDLTNLPPKPEFQYSGLNSGSLYPMPGGPISHPSNLSPDNYGPFSGPPNSGYGLYGQSGVYRDSNNNADINEYISNNPNETNYLYTGNFMYQDFYPQNQQLQTNRPFESHYANNYQNYDNRMTYQSDVDPKDYSNTSRNSKAVKFPTSRRRKRSSKTINISKNIIENESTKKVVTKVRLKLIHD